MELVPTRKHSDCTGSRIGADNAPQPLLQEIWPVLY